MADVYQTFYIGVNNLVVRNGQLLLGKRKNVYGEGTWGLCGGHLETGEDMESTAARELMEETGLKAERYLFSNLVNNNGNKSGKHYLQVGFIAEGVVGEPSLKEPDRCEEWKWFDLNDLPKNIFPSHVKQIENYIKEQKFADD